MFYLTNVEEVKSKIYLFGYNEKNEKVMKKNIFFSFYIVLDYLFQVTHKP